MKRDSIWWAVALAIVTSCQDSSHREMLSLLGQKRLAYDRADNYYAAGAQADYYDSLINSSNSPQDRMRFTYDKARALIALGKEGEAIKILEPQVQRIREEKIQGMDRLKELLALAYLRNGERINCIRNHSPETCILPMKGAGIHRFPEGSQNAVKLYEELLTDYPKKLEYRWLLNIAYMTLGEYPAKIPQGMLVPNLERPSQPADSGLFVRAFEDVAASLSLDVNNMAGGCIADDFDNDGYLDIVTSSWSLAEGMHYFRNNADGTFSDRSVASGLSDLTGGLNLMQLDYNNDGYKDIFVLRGAWLTGHYGEQPNSLLKNNGDGTFTDVTIAAGLLSFHPTQTATWNDFNNDGWLDVFVGNESWEGNASSGLHPAELFVNNQDGTFTNVASEAGVDIIGFIKGVTSGDYDNDGWKDIFATSMTGDRFLLRNRGVEGRTPMFENVSREAGVLPDTVSRTFSTWFWDYNNDGWLDIYLGDFTFNEPIAYYSAAEALGISTQGYGRCILYRNNGDGSFTNVSQEMNLTSTAFAMGANFGDINNDGYLDFYLGTGNPELESIVPNKLFQNVSGNRFVDVTAPARVGHLQKGHGISFADVDNDGDQDIYAEMGGAYTGDAFHNAFYINPGQDESNHWIVLDLVGKTANRSAIGARVKVTITEGGIKRSIYRDVNSGGSFGASPLRREIGIGRAEIIDEIEIQWHPGKKQVFRNVEPDQFLRITEGSHTLERISLERLDFAGENLHRQHVH